MPELPEIEIVKRSLFKMINKAKIIDVKVNNKNLRYKIPTTFTSSLTGEKIYNISRRSKYLIFHLKKKLLLAHLGMSGKILIKKNKFNIFFKTSFYYDLNIDQKHNHIIFKLNNGISLIYNDPRRFGFFKLYAGKNINKITFLKKLGVEPFNQRFNVKYFYVFIKNRKKNIKSLLMDQTFVSGLGNIYVCEALFRSKINPKKNCSKFVTSKGKPRKNLILLVKKINEVIKEAIEVGGSTLRDFSNINGKMGYFQSSFNVYNRENEKCLLGSCDGVVKRIIQSGRSTFFCSKCQR